MQTGACMQTNKQAAESAACLSIYNVISIKSAATSVSVSLTMPLFILLPFLCR